MSRQRRNFSAKFKSDLVIELLKGEKDLNTLATENNIQPNLLRNWKKEFLNNASAVFDDKREENLKDKLAEERKEKAEYAKKVGQLTMQMEIKVILKSLYREKNRLNSYENQIPIDYACGWALSSDDMSCTMQMLLDDADAYMYKNKQLCKKYN